jgi:hypothetical protein
MELRPLGFGEIFDRAITLYIRNFVPFVGIVAVIVVPLAFLQYVLDAASAPEWDQMIKILTHPGKPPPPTLPAFLATPGALAQFVALIVVVWILWPFALNACTVGVARLYRGRPVDFTACYSSALRPWLSVLGLLLLELVILIGWYVGLLVAVILSTVMTIVFSHFSLVLGFLVGIVGFTMSLAVLVSAAPLLIALTFAMNAIVIEERPIFAAVGLGFVRVFNRREFWRAVLFALASSAVTLGGAILVGSIVTLAMLHHWVGFEVVITSLFRAAIVPFSVVLLAVYYFDVRIRREGYEIEAELDRLAGTPAA